jgi:hypothetical protein
VEKGGVTFSSCTDLPPFSLVSTTGWWPE